MDRPKYHAWYRSRRWAKLKNEWLARHPYCQCPHHKDQKVKAEVVDHKQPHRGDERLFWSTGNLQSLTVTCHSKYKQSQEIGGYGFAQGSDEHGMPLVNQPGWAAQ